MIKRALRWLAGLILLVSTAIFINFVGVMFAYTNYWFPRMAAGRMTFFQALYAEWIWYCTGHRHSWVVADDLLGLAFVLVTASAIGYFKWRQHNWQAAVIVNAETGLTSDNAGVWPPAPKR